MNSRGRGRSGRSGRVPAALGSALIGATLLLRGEETGEPQGDPDAPAPAQPREAPPAAMPAPGFGAMRLELLAETAPPAKPAARRAKETQRSVRPDGPVAAPMPAVQRPAAEAAVAHEEGEAAPEPALALAGAVPVPANAAPEGSAVPVPVPVAVAPTEPVAVSGPVAGPEQVSEAEPVPEASPGAVDGTGLPAPQQLALADAARLPPAVADALPRPAFGGAASVQAAAPVGLATVPAAVAPPAPPSRDPAPAAAGLVLPKPQFGHVAPGLGRAGPVADAAALAPAGQAPMAGFVPAAAFSGDDELILQVETAHGEVADTVTAYGTRAGVYLPLGEVARLLDLAIAISDDGRYASGWVLDEKQQVSINLREGVMRVGGREIALAPREAAAFDGELYLKAERFADLMPLALQVDLRAQTVTVKTAAAFPFEQRAAREAARERLGSQGGQGQRHDPRETTPWQALSFPIGEVELRGVSDTAQGTRAEGDIRLAGDLAFMTARVFASTSTREGVTAARIELGRRDPDGGLLGPLRATEFQLGDVSTAALPLGLRGIGGRGAMVSNTPLERVSVFDRIDLRGDLPDGYEAELYRNNTLVGSTRSGVNGQYEFLQVPVEFGLNVFRLVLYGPQGQRREQVRRITVGDGRLGKGEFLYSVGVAQKDVNLLDVRAANFVPGQDFGAWRATAQVQYGLTTGLTTVLGGGWYQSLGGTHWLATGGLRSGLGGVAARLDLGIADGGGKAVTAGLGGKLAGINWTATHAEYFGRFSDELAAFTIDPLRRASEVDANATLHFGSAAAPRVMPLAARFRRIEYADGRAETQASLRASLLVSRLLASNALTYDRSSRPGGPTVSRLTGGFDLATLSGSRTQVRGSLDYDLLPRVKLNAAQVELDRAIGKDTLVKAAVGHVLTSHDTTLGLSAVRRFRQFSLAFDGTMTLPRRTYAATLRLGFSFGRNPLTRSLFVDRPGLAAGGAVAIRAWADEDGDHRFGPGEKGIEGVEFDTGAVTGRTDRQGVALIGGIGDGTRVGVHINAETLPDIAMAPVSEGVEIVPRPGRIHVSGFAIEALSEIEGGAWLGAGGRGVSGLHLLLVDGTGKPVAKARTAAGGSFLFEQVRPGRYRLAIDPGQAQRLGIALVDAPLVVVGPKATTVRVELNVAVRGGTEK
ncbi:MAG: hypothetical protein KGM17_07740 [Sphingomonadales bacterium]|nr:hypothetical protein [Sphingomonadales bacterium]